MSRPFGASHDSDREKALVAKINLAKVAVEERGSRQATGDLHALGQQTEGLGLKYLSTECSLYFGEALVESKNYSRAREELDAVVRKVEDSGLKSLLPQGHYWLATALRLSGHMSEAAPHYATALGIIEDFQKEPGAEHITERSDLHRVYTESVRWAKPAIP
jgi:predicted negative regulator of RcsB-dependent stress response